MEIKNRLWKDGKKCCLTMSYDDGTKFDYRLVELFNRCGIRGTFNLNAGFLKDDYHVKPEDIRSLYDGHEVACHSYSHPTLPELPSTIILEEILKDKEALEKWCGYTVRGMAYPNGPYDTRVMELCRSCGMNYARTCNATMKYRLPFDFMELHPTCHHGASLGELWQKFVDIPPFSLNMPLLYIWGHSYEFDKRDNWDVIEDFCRMASDHPDVWYATNIEMVDYVRAQRMVDYGVDRHSAYNPSAVSVWIDVAGKPVELRPGENRF